MATSEEAKFCKKLLLDQQQQVEALQNGCRKIIKEQPVTPLDTALLEIIKPVVKSIMAAQKLVKIGCVYGIGVAVDFLDESSPLSLDDKEKKKLDEVLKKRKAPEQRRVSAIKCRFATLSDVCKACGELGHWWNDPKCKNYNGPSPRKH